MMRMNQITFSIMILVLIALALVSAALAVDMKEEAAISSEVAGTTPDSAFYGLDKAIDKIKLALIFDKAKRAEESLKISQERLAELKLMLELGKENEALKSQAEYEASIKSAEISLDDLQTDDTSEKTKDTLEKIARLRNRTEDNLQRVAKIHEDILVRLEDKLTAEQYEHLKKIFNKIENSTLAIDARLESKKEAAKIKYKILTGKSEEEIEVEINDLEKKSGLDESRRRRAEHNIEKAASAIERAEERLQNANLTAEEKAEIQSHIDLLKEILEEANSTLQNQSKESQDLGKHAREFGNEVSEIAKLLGDAKRTMSNNSFDNFKEKLREEIRERHEENKERVLEKLRERYDDENKTEIKLRMEAIAADMKIKYEERIKADEELKEKLKEEFEERKREGPVTCPAIAIDSCKDGYELQIFELGNGCKMQKCVGQNDSGVCPANNIKSCSEGFDLVETKLDNGCEIQTCIEEGKEQRICPNTIMPRCSLGYLLQDFKTEGGCKIYKCVKKELEQNNCPSISTPVCVQGTLPELFIDDNGCKQYRCIEVKIAVCPTLATPDCQEGYELEDYKDEHDCKQFKCVAVK